MPLILSDANTRTMSNEELLMSALKEYATPSSWESYEKDYGVGRPVERAPWTSRDRGEHARQALDIIAQRKAQASDELKALDAVIADAHIGSHTSGHGESSDHISFYSTGREGAEAFLRAAKSYADIIRAFLAGAK